MPTVRTLRISSSSLGQIGGTRYSQSTWNELFERAPTWSDESGFALLGGQHQHGEDELRRQKHLDEDSLGDGGPIGQGCGECRFTGEHASDEGRCLDIPVSARLLGSMNLDHKMGPAAQVSAQIGQWAPLLTTIPPSIWAGNRSAPRSAGRVPVMLIVRRLSILFLI